MDESRRQKQSCKNKKNDQIKLVIIRMHATEREDKGKKRKVDRDTTLEQQ